MEPSPQQPVSIAVPATPRPLGTTLTARQVTAGTLISRSFSVWWGNLGRFGMVQLLVIGPAAVANALVSKAAFGSYFVSRSDLALLSDVRKLMLVNAAIMVAMTPFMLVQMGGLAFGTIQHLAGSPVRVGAMVKTGLRLLWPLFLAALLVFSAILGGYLLLVIPGIMIALATSVTAPAVMAERLRPVAAFKRSLYLTRGHRWSLLAAFAVTSALLLGVSVAATLTAGAAPLAGALASLAASIVCGPLPLVVPAVAYHDLRAAKEGVATAELVKVFE